MSRRSRASGGAVRGPSSALTSFLAGLGVEPSHRVTTWGNTTALDPQNNGEAEGQSTPADDAGTPLTYGNGSPDPASGVTARNVEAGPSQVGEGTPKPDMDEDTDSDDLDARPKRKRRAASVDSDDLDAPTAAASTNGTSTPVEAPKKGKKGTSARPQPLKAIGEFMNCGNCDKKFTVTAYTKEHPRYPQTWLCVDCCYKVGIDPFSKPKKGPGGGKKAPVKEERGKVVHYEERKGVLPLSDLCIVLIGKYIDDVEQLGYIGSINLDKVCKIISKSRRLVPDTAKLFYSIDRTELTMYDCTNLVHDSYVTMAKLSPHLEDLRLHLCGQLQTDSVKSWGTLFRSLRRLELFAPFLVRQEGWQSFFKSAGRRLEGFLVTQSPRIDLETIEVMVKSCPELHELRLAEVGKLDDACLVPLAKLKKLETLDLSSPANSLSDPAVIDLLEAVGSGLRDLNLSDNHDLTDAVLDAIVKYCPNLLRLRVRNLDLTDDGVSKFFTDLLDAGRPGLTHLDLEKGHELSTAALDALLAHSAGTIEDLSILGWKEVDPEAVGKIGTEGRCKQLKILDLGWCRRVTDFTLKDILEGCPKIEEIRVWGCNELTDAVPRKKGVKVIGIETHSI